MSRFRGVILDIDGTLVDSNDAYAHAWVAAFAEQGITVPFEKVRPLIGMGGDKLMPRVSDIAEDTPEGKRISKRRGEIFKERYLPTLKAFPGARELLHRLRYDGFRLGVASSAKKDELHTLLKICGADEVIESMTSSDDADNSKPDPDIVQAALGQMDLPAAESVLLGDTPYDFLAAGRAGVAVIAFRCGGWKDKDLAGAIAVYDGPGDLLANLSMSPLGKASPSRT